MTIEGAESGSYEGRPRLVKLVRDRIGQFLDGRNNHVVYRPIEDGDVIVKELRRKLVEEAVEYLLDPSVGEAADILAALTGLVQLDLQVTWDEVVAEFRAKEEERGGLVGGMGMWVTTLADGRHEGDKA